MTTPHAKISPHLLLVEDEASLALTLSDRLKAEGYVVEHCVDGESALNLLENQAIDLMILDLMLPGIDGFEVCRELRQRGLRLPVLMLTARTEVTDKVVGLKLGADDYLTKPFEMVELLARLEALLRRTATGPTGSQLYEFEDIRVDFHRAEVTRAGRPVALSSMEFRLLQEFIEHRGEILSREHLLDEVWGYESTPYSRTVDVHVASLRQKLEETPAHPRFIMTVHRRGYRFDG